jgi:hypothetical protein
MIGKGKPQVYKGKQYPTILSLAKELDLSPIHLGAAIHRYPDDIDKAVEEARAKKEAPAKRVTDINFQYEGNIYHTYSGLARKLGVTPDLFNARCHIFMREKGVDRTEAIKLAIEWLKARKRDEEEKERKIEAKHQSQGEHFLVKYPDNFVYNKKEHIGENPGHILALVFDRIQKYTKNAEIGYGFTYRFSIEVSVNYYKKITEYTLVECNWLAKSCLDKLYSSPKYGLVFSVFVDKDIESKTKLNVYCIATRKERK